MSTLTDPATSQVMHDKSATRAASSRRSLPGDRWDAAAAGVVVLQAGLVAWLVIPGGLYIDDLRAQAYAADRGIWPFIIESNRTHLSPGARTFDWLQAQFWPLRDEPAVAITVVTSALLGFGVWRLVRLLVPRPAVALTGLFLALISASLVPALAWYRQAITTILPLAIMLIALDSSIRYFRRLGSRWALLAGVLHPVALAFSERALVLPVVVAVAGMVLVTERPWAARLRSVGALTAPMAAVNLVFLAFYGSGSYDTASQASPTVEGFVLSTLRSAFVNTVPALVGGPVSWRSNDPAYAFAATPTVLVAGSGLAFALLLAAALRSRGGSRGQAVRVAVVALAYALPIYVMLYIGRVSRAAITSVDDLRLHPDIGVFAAITVTALLAAALPHGSPGRLGRVVVALPLVLVAGLSLWSWQGFSTRWHSSPTSDYLSTLRQSLEANRATVVPGPVPADVVPGWVQADFSTGSLVRLLDPETELSLADGPSRIVDASGTLVPATLRVVATAPIVAEDFCGTALPQGRPDVIIEFDEPVPYYRGSHLSLRTIVSDTTSLNVAVLDSEGNTVPAPVFARTELFRGPHTTLVPVPYGTRVSAVAVSRSRETASVCIPGLSVVLPEVSR